jgi:ATP-binding cassette subfamily F protein uup
VVIRGKNTRVAYFDQTRAQLDPEQTVYQAAADSDVVNVGGRTIELKDYLADLLFPVAMQKLKVGALSGGEKNRLLLAKLLLSGANLLVLDEPTNDLDILTLQVLEEMLLDFGGSVLLVTHDRFFLDKVATAILAFEGAGKVTRYPGNHEMYLRLRPPRRLAEPAAPRRVSKPLPAAGSAPKKKLTYAEELRLSEMEPSIEKAEAEKARLEQALADPELYRLRGGLVAGLRAELERANGEVERLWAEWQALESRS